MTSSGSAPWRLALAFVALLLIACACTAESTTIRVDLGTTFGDEDENCDPDDCYADYFDDEVPLEEVPDDDTAEGNTAEGDTAPDNTAEGNTAQGDTAPDNTAEGNTAQGDTAEGNAGEGDRATEAATDADDTAAESEVLTGGGVNLSLDRTDIDCSTDGLGSDDTIEFVVAHVVVDGDLGALCFGDRNQTLIQSWEALSAITPPGQLRDLGLFGGFVAGNEDDGTTLAFVNTLDDDGSLFQMSINLDEADADPDELMLTMAHEFSHVFTATSAEIDRASSPNSCETYYNGEGCYRAVSLMAEWVDLFWSDGLIDEIDPESEATVSGGEERCAANPAFFGSYAASNPEEDFAEAFSAYVFGLVADTTAQQEKLDWFAAQPGLAEFRQRAESANAVPLDNNFDRCG